MVDFPTPPLHEETAMTWRTPRRPSIESGMSFISSAGRAVMTRFTDSTQSISEMNALLWRSNSSFTGHAGVVSSSVNVTSLPSRITRSLTKPQFTTSSPKSGSMTLRRAANTSASFEPSGADVIGGEEETGGGSASRPRGGRSRAGASRRARITISFVSFSFRLLFSLLSSLIFSLSFSSFGYILFGFLFW